EGTFDGHVPQRRQLRLYLCQDPLANGGLEHGEEQQHPQVVEIVQDRPRVVEDLRGSQLFQVVVATEVAVPRGVAPVFSAQALHRSRQVAGCFIPAPRISEGSNHDSKSFRMASNCSRSSSRIPERSSWTNHCSSQASFSLRYR